MPEDILDTLKKIKRLVDGGATEGERAAAQSRLEALMEKHGVTPEQLAEPDADELWIMRIRLKNKAEFALAVQVLGVVTHSSKVRIHKIRRGLLGYRCTRLQHMEFEELLPYYLKAYRKQQEEFMNMFIQANRLFPEVEEGEEETAPLTPEQLEKLMRMLAGAKAISKTPTPHKKLTAG